MSFFLSSSRFASPNSVSSCPLLLPLGCLLLPALLLTPLPVSKASVSTGLVASSGAAASSSSPLPFFFLFLFFFFFPFFPAPPSCPASSSPRNDSSSSIER